ncbi:MAG: hypothetical protein U5N55_09910 [Cypionkella sp.]|nr:hypothetical protein [Cypionkella sp.]
MKKGQQADPFSFYLPVGLADLRQNLGAILGGVNAKAGGMSKKMHLARILGKAGVKKKAAPKGAASQTGRKSQS